MRSPGCRWFIAAPKGASPRKLTSHQLYSYPQFQMGGQGLDAPAFKYERNAQCASGVAAATACDHYHVHDGRASRRRTRRRACRCACRWRRCPRIRGCGALALRRGRQNGRHSLPRPATHARHDFETECVVARNLDHRRSVADQRALRLVRHAACHVTATPRRARPSCSIEWAQHEARLGRPCSLPSLVTYRATSRPRPAWRQCHQFQAAWSTPHCALVTGLSQ